MSWCGVRPLVSVGGGLASPLEAPLPCRPQPERLPVYLPHPSRSEETSGAGQLPCALSRWCGGIWRGPGVALGSWVAGPEGRWGGARREALGLGAHVLGASPGHAASLRTRGPSSRKLSCAFGMLLPALCSDTEDASGPRAAGRVPVTACVWPTWFSGLPRIGFGRAAGRALCVASGSSRGLLCYGRKSERVIRWPFSGNFVPSLHI